jgi:hypothetical protein
MMHNKITDILFLFFIFHTLPDHIVKSLNIILLLVCNTEIIQIIREGKCPLKMLISDRLIDFEFHNVPQIVPQI